MRQAIASHTHTHVCRSNQNENFTFSISFFRAISFHIWLRNVSSAITCGAFHWLNSIHSIWFFARPFAQINRAEETVEKGFICFVYVFVSTLKDRNQLVVHGFVWANCRMPVLCCDFFIRQKCATLPTAVAIIIDVVVVADITIHCVEILFYFHKSVYCTWEQCIEVNNYILFRCQCLFHCNRRWNEEARERERE